MSELEQRVNKLENLINLFFSSSTLPHEVEQAFRTRLFDLSTDGLPDGFETAPLTSISSPSGGATVDSQARSAIDTIITRMEDLGLIDPN